MSECHHEELLEQAHNILALRQRMNGLTKDLDHVRAEGERDES